MCGIVGSNFRPDNQTQLLQTLKDRGPNYEGFCHIANIFLAHTRLAITDIHPRSNQPMSFEHLHIVFNGEIYNYQYLIQKHNLSCQTKSDTEVIILLYQKLGVLVLDELDGIFAFCIYDAHLKRFFCARDRFGKKPFFYYYKNGQFIFASKISTILKAITYTPPMNQRALSEYLQFFTPLAPNTFYQDIYKLPNATYLIFEDNEIVTKKYYHIKRKKTINTINEAITSSKELLQKAIHKRIPQEVKGASLLSGGLDSSLVSAIYARHQSTPIECFSVGYEDFKKYDELSFAKITAKHIGAKHHTLELCKKLFIQTLETTLECMDEPHADSAAIALSALMHDVRDQGFKVLLSGEGSDELFFGYPNAKKVYEFANFFASLTQEQKDFLKNIHKSLANQTKESEYLRRLVHGENYYSGYGEIFTKTLKDDLYKHHKPLTLPLEIDDPLDNIAMMDFKLWLGEALLSKIDTVGMSYGVEIRAPFLDVGLVENSFKIQSQIRFANHPKNIIKEIAKDYLPDCIIHRKKKAFNLPFNEWIHQEYQDDILTTILKANDHHQLFNETTIENLFYESKNNHFRQHIWTLFVFSKWYAKNYLSPI